jgi:hypothetical protein
MPYKDPKTTHADIVNAMKNAKNGGGIGMADGGSTTDLDAMKLALIWKLSKDANNQLVKTQVPRQWDVHTFDITPAMREDVLKNGIPRYDEGGIIHKAEGGSMNLTTDQMRAALMGKSNTTSLSNLQSVGANEAPSLPVKSFIPPHGRSDNGSIPVGGVDENVMQPGQQMMPQQPQQPGQPQPGQPQAQPQQGQPQPPQGLQSNILSMTHQGQAMDAMRPTGMATGGGVHGYAGGDGVTRRDQTVSNPQRMAYSSIYKRPDVIASEAAAQVAPEDPSLKRLFNVTRDDLYEMGKGRKGNLPGTLPGVARNPGGSEAASGVMNRRNEQRILDAMSEAEKHPHLVRGMDPWYVMDPMFQRMVELIGLESAKKEYTKMNTLMGMSSPGSEVLTEIPRGTAAYALQKQNRFDDFIRYAGMAEDKRGKKFPADIRNVPGHFYHRTGQAGPMEQYLTSGAMQMKSPKVPMYIEASGVPETGFQTATPVGDAHWSRAVGLADTRGKRMSKGKEITPGASVSNPEMAALAPWWRKKIAEKLGIESVPAQARLWGTMSPQTGVTTPIGAPKLELISRKIMETAHRLGISPESARDMVLRGQTYAGKAEGGKVKMAKGGENLPAHPGLGREGNILRLPVAKPKTKSEIRAIAERMAPQIIGQDFVRPPGGTWLSVADKTQKQFNREKSLQNDIRPIGNQPTYSDVDLADYKDKVMIGLAGDATPTNRVIHGVGGTDLVRPSTQKGGPLYGLHNPGKSWASNHGAASGVLSLAEAAARQYGVEGSDVLANYIKMSPEGTNFAQHFADALLATIDPSKLTKKDIMYMNAVIKSGNLKNPKGFLSAPSVVDSDAMYNAMLQDPELRKHFANRMMMAAVHKGRNIIPGPDVLHAATEPELRDLETGVTGFSVGKIPSKNAKLTPSTHPTYSHDIPGNFLGRLAVPLPYEMAFPDAVQAIKNSPRHANTLFGTLKSSGARQQITPQLINEIGEYRRHIKRLTGKAEGGMVGLSNVVGKKPQPSMDEMQAALTLRKGSNKVDMSSIGAYEAPDLPVKIYSPPGPGQLPVGGVDMSDTPGQQFVPMDQQAQQQPGQQQPGQQPPQGPGAAPQAPQGAPQGADSNILQMTPQGQAMAAMTPSQNSQPPDQTDDQKPLQGMAEGGSPKPVYTHEVYDIKTKKVKGQYQSANAARRGVDYYDNQYGGYRHDYRQINKPPSEGMARGGSVNLALPRVQKKADGGDVNAMRYALANRAKAK